MSVSILSPTITELYCDKNLLCHNTRLEMVHMDELLIDEFVIDRNDKFV